MLLSCMFNSCLIYRMLILFSRSGPKKWRLGTQYTPSFILNKYCEDLGIEHYFSKRDNSMLTLKCGGKERPFTIQDFGKLFKTLVSLYNSSYWT